MFKKKQPEMYIPPELQAYYAPQAKAKKQFGKKRIIIAVVALVAVIALGIGIGLLLSHNANDPFVNNGQPSGSSEQAPKTDEPASVPNNSVPSSGAVESL